MTFAIGHKIYHITPIDALPGIVQSGHLYSNATMDQLSVGGTSIGISNLKKTRRLRPVPCHPGTFVGDYAPFYFCPRSIMLYLLHKGNHPELDYKGGQDPVLHLEYDLNQVINWADSQHRIWAFSLSNASAQYTQFFADQQEMHQINWEAVAANLWTAPEIKEGKQAEFLVYGGVPWEFVERVGVKTSQTGQLVLHIISAAGHKPKVQVLPEWYYN